jgi:hypothetical protein
MKLTFSDIAGSQAYQAEAATTAKANIFIATVVAVLIMIFASWGFGLWWFVIIPVLWFASSLLVAMPFMVLRMTVAAALSEHFGKARLAGGLLDLANYVVLVPATYYGLRYLHSLFF